MTIDPKKRRLRLYRSALHKLGEPDYVQFLVSPRQGMLIVKIPEIIDATAHKIYWTKLEDNDQCCEFYSKKFIERLYDELVVLSRNDSHSLRVKGKFFPDETMLVFDLFYAEPISGEAEAVEDSKCERKEDTSSTN